MRAHTRSLLQNPLPKFFGGLALSLSYTKHWEEIGQSLILFIANHLCKIFGGVLIPLGLYLYLVANHHLCTESLLTSYMRLRFIPHLLVLYCHRVVLNTLGPTIPLVLCLSDSQIALCVIFVNFILRLAIP